MILTNFFNYFFAIYYSVVQVQVDLDVREENYDQSNLLALPASKRDTSKTVSEAKKEKRLTKKERRKLEKILEVKEKKTKVL